MLPEHGDYQYYAFISYNRNDVDEARELHEFIEDFSKIYKNYQNYFDDLQRAYPKLMIPAGVDVIHISTTNKLRFCLIVPQDEMDSDITNGKRITLMGKYSVYPSSSGYGINSYYYTYETVNYEEAQRTNAFEDFIFWSGTWYSRFYV